MKKVLVTGGAGYIGSILVRLLLESGYAVKVVDNLRFGGEPIIDYLNYPQFEFVKGDVRDESLMRDTLKDVNYVTHLAAVVGDPACKQEPELAKETNEQSSKAIYRIANELGVEKFVFASTCSNYGKMDEGGAYVDENSKLAPVSLYAETKVETEKYLLGQPATNTCKPTCLRFSTVYGLSQRLRFDLTVNEFTKELALGRELVVFGEQFWRPYCHVIDLARSVLYVFDTEEEKVASEVFNVGDTSENYQKQMIINEILKQIPEGKVKYVHKEEDPRDYRVNFDKIKNQLGFKISKKVPEGITQIKTVVEQKFIADPDDQKFRNS